MEQSCNYCISNQQQDCNCGLFFKALATAVPGDHQHRLTCEQTHSRITTKNQRLQSAVSCCLVLLVLWRTSLLESSSWPVAGSAPRLSGQLPSWTHCLKRDGHAIRMDSPVSACFNMFHFQNSGKYRNHRYHIAINQLQSFQLVEKPFFGPSCRRSNLQTIVGWGLRAAPLSPLRRPWLSASPDSILLVQKVLAPKRGPHRGHRTVQPQMIGTNGSKGVY